MTSSDVDPGPLFALMQAVQEGSVGLGAAKETARAYGAGGEVTPQQLVGLASASLNVAEQGQWRRALPFADLAYEAALAASAANPQHREFGEALLSVGADLIEIFHWALSEQGDIRMFLRAREIAEAGTAEAERLGMQRMQGLLALRFGTLVLDAYTANRTPSNYEGQFRAWVARAMQSNDPELRWLVSTPIGAEGEPEPDSAPPRWPSPLDALDIAERHLRAALPLVAPQRRGRTLKALSQALEWRDLVGGSTDPVDLRAVAEEALNELDPADTQARLAVTATLERLGVAPTGDDLVETLEREWDAYAAKTEARLAWDAVGQAATVLQQRDPARALALLERQRELAEPWGDEALRARHFEDVLLLYSRAFGPEGFNPFSGDRDEAAEQALALTDGAPARQAAAALLGTMLATTSVDREALGLALAQRLSQLPWNEHRDAVAFLVASLLRGEGVNRMRAGDVDAAGTYYCQAASAYREVGMPSAMVQCLEYLDDVVLDGATVLDELTAWLAAESLGIELAAPSSAPRMLQSLGAHVLARQVASRTSPEAVQLLLGVIKGRRFAAMLSRGTAGFQLDERVRHLLSREAEAEAALPADSDVLRAAPFEAGMGDDDMVTAWVDEFEEGPSDTPEDRVANLQRATEQALGASLIPDSAPPLAMPADIRDRLGERTALLQIYEGPWVDGSLATWQILLTHDVADVAVGNEGMPCAPVRASWQGRAATMPPSGFYVGALRRAVQEDVDPLDIAPDGESMLAGAAERYLRVVHDNRERLAGIERIVVVPHGSSRCVPIHLAGPTGRPLADDYVVTYLSNVAQLTVEPRPASRRESVGVFGLSYADQPRLPRLDGSAAEATAIADVCGTTPVLDGDASEEAFTRALETDRYVHLRAHGRLYVDAPSFHTVFLHPAGDDDGRLRAYEVLPLDLSGLELVTLGACETALGRVDQSDNPRGLPAALLLAGARSVVGTLWPVAAEVSTLFFAELYRSLTAEDGGVASAFASAQRATRDTHPQYRHWGAFYLMGGLDDKGLA